MLNVRWEKGVWWIPASVAQWRVHARARVDVNTCTTLQMRGAQSRCREQSAQVLRLWTCASPCGIQLVEERPSSSPDPCIQQAHRQREAPCGGQGRQGLLHMGGGLMLCGGI